MPSREEELSAALVAAFGAPFTVSSVANVGDGANNGTHFKLTCADGRVFGLKTSSRGVASGTQREYLAAYTARTLDLPGAGLCALIGLPPSFGATAGQQSVLLEWLPGAVKLRDAGPPTAVRRSDLTAGQVGAWMWLALGLQISDRHPGNWIWSEQGGVFAMIDFEEWSPGSQQPAQLASIVKEVLGDPVSLDNAIAMRTSLQSVSASWVAKQAAITGTFAAHGEAVPATLTALDVTATVEGLTGFTASQLAPPPQPAGPQAVAAPSPQQP